MPSGDHARATSADTINTSDTVGTLDTEGTMARTPEDLERALAAGEWLRPGDVAILLGVARATIVRMLNADPPEFRYRVKPGTGRHRELNPADVRRALDRKGTVHGDDEGPSPS